MCGIIGYLGPRPITEVLLDGLRRLEYRGYDSAGLAILDNGTCHLHRSSGKLRNLERRIAGKEKELSGTVGLGHTRWATHGGPSEENAHPHRAGDVVLVHNGIIENYLELKRMLSEHGRTFSSETDTEIIAHLIDQTMKASSISFLDAVRSAVARVRGSFACGIMHLKEPKTLIAVKNASPLILGIGDGEYFLASDIPALLNYTQRVVFLEDGQIARVTGEGIEISTLAGRPVSAEIHTISWNPVMAEKGGHKHFMLKEIHEQPTALIHTIEGRIAPDGGKINLDGIEDRFFEGIEKVAIIACGTSWHAGLCGKFMIEEHARIPVEVDYGSEFRYRDPILDERTLLVPISQSGETADTLAALREGREKGARILSICNVIGSSIARGSDHTLLTHAGPEIGVASTKAFTTQLTVLYLLSLHLGALRGRFSSETLPPLLNDLKLLPHKIDLLLEAGGEIRKLAKNFVETRNFLYLGRGIHYPIALEGALKLKEISYIHAEGYPAGEMKHGPIALIDASVPIVILAPHDRSYEKVQANLEEVKARGGLVIAVTDRSDPALAEKADHLLVTPSTNRWLTPILQVIPLQLFAYHVADFKGTDIDQPRNLAKSVTVE